MSSVQWVQLGAAASDPMHEPARADRRRKPIGIRLEPIDIMSIFLVLAIIASGIVASVWAVHQYRWEQAAYAAFKARHIHDIVVPPVYDWPGRERLVGQMLGGAGFLIVELVAGLVLRRHARAISRGERRERKPRPPSRAAQIVVQETFRPAATEAKSRPAAAERAATVIWGDRVARHEAAPHGT
ncbi:MAG: hypothetical protein ACREFB_11720 [Stellaceae bacterium]